MDGAQSSSKDNSGGSGGGPAPFLIKTYEMVDDSKTDDVVSWSSSTTSFVVWNPPEFARLLLPTYFKHNNFSSFIRQLNTYGFRKIDPERWEFANEDFVKDQKHMLKNIHRRKPIHSHSLPQQQGTSYFGDTERAALEEEIENLTGEKNAFLINLNKFIQQQDGTKALLEMLEQRVREMEQRQERMISFVHRAISNPSFVDQLVRHVQLNTQFPLMNKKRRLPKVDFLQEVVENNFVDNQIIHSASEINTLKPMLGFAQNVSKGFANKLKLELSPAASDNLLSGSGHSSYEDGDSPQVRTSREAPKEVGMRAKGFLFVSDGLELSDTGTSLGSEKVNTQFPCETVIPPEPHGVRQCSTSTEEGDGNISCHLNLTLSSSPLPVNRSDTSTRIAPSHVSQEKDASAEIRSSSREDHFKVLDRSPAGNNKMPSSRELANKVQAPQATVGRVNDVFWEQFLTERPGSSDAEEASSSFRGHLSEERDDRTSAFSKSWNSKQNMEQLTL
ncbi:hypothetical protein AMTRI_Chr06g172980 [Amborella trichopoda]|uniref:HSF-type DNA-binding domain-containing protein n=1 Tax=Amborella trichopoda TaxID=13333 RepID=W1PPW2_AMBTC|nr:heat stress transcription factor A-5 [Amborella trichopoda]XP_020525548.1 heat stress transcription factor A-5 [Amborella trichopoda]XP_020525549.1 heat stress transcription factor A-5 [Amborella trichopoda]ERN10103.1 hypothetical protein AMTR_s00013p00262410 [Amborella trichopoda]|eukprot:XP_006848522.1 heat stress transcription factor A-5 [Amborella trichopoda]